MRVGDTTRAARVTDRSVELLGVPDVRALLSIGPDWPGAVDDLVTGAVDPALVDYAPLVPAPSEKNATVAVPLTLPATDVFTPTASAELLVPPAASRFREALATALPVVAPKCAELVAGH